MASAGPCMLSLLSVAKCALCLHQAETPHVLSCNHSLCKKCFEICQKEKLGKFTCPQCRLQTILKDAEMPDLKHDISTITLMEKLENERRKQDDKKICQVCGDIESARVSSTYCSGCGNMLTYHTSSEVPPLSRPTPLPENEQNMEIFCERHEGKTKDLFCKVCLTPVCKECSATDHCEKDNHECIPMVDYAPMMREEIQARLSKLANLYEQWENIIPEIKNMEEFLKNQKEVIDTKIETAVGQFVHRVKGALVNKNGKFFQFRNQTLWQLRQEVEGRVEEIGKHRIKTKDILEQSGDQDLAAMYKKLSASLDLLLSETPDQSKLKAVNRTTKLEFQLHKDGSHVGSLVSPCLERRDISLAGTRNPRALTFTRDGRLAVLGLYYSNVVIKSTTISFKSACEFGIEIIASLGDYTSSLASLSDLRFVIDRPSEKEAVYHVNELPGSISSIVTDLEDNIYCSVPSCKRIFVARTDETMRKSIPTGDLTPQQIAVCPCSPDRIIFTHDSSKISVIDREGKLLRTINRPQWKEVAIGCNNDKLLYVLWKNDAGRRTLQRFYLNGDLFDTLFEGESNFYDRLLLAVSPDGTAAVIKKKGESVYVSLVSVTRSLPEFIKH